MFQLMIAIWHSTCSINNPRQKNSKENRLKLQIDVAGHNEQCLIKQTSQLTPAIGLWQGEQE
jgi:hypothetical protein